MRRNHTMQTTTLAIAAAMAAGSFANSQTTWTVCQDGSCDFDTIQEAVDAAADGDTVEIGPGTYTGSGTNVVDMVEKNVHLIGIAGPDATIIDGETQRRGIYIQDNGSKAASLSGLTITQCVAEGPGGLANQRGAGLLLRNSAIASVTHCVFGGNHADYQGAAVCIENNSVLSLSDCLFTENSVAGPKPWYKWRDAVIQVRSAGGGPSCQENSSSASVIRCVFWNNNAQALRWAGSDVAADSVYIAATASDAELALNAVNCSDAVPPAELHNVTIQVDLPLAFSAVVTLVEEAAGPGFELLNSTICGDFADSAPIEGPWTDLGNNRFGGPCSLPIHAEGVSTFDCDSNGLFDFFEIADGLVTDVNRNGVPDTCECIADLTGNGEVNGADISIILGFWGKVPEPLPSADINRDGLVDGLDLAVLLGSWGPCQ